MTHLIPEMCRRSLSSYQDGSGDISISVDSQYAAIWFPDESTAVVAIRGSELELKDWLRNLEFRMDTPGVHHGFSDGAAKLLLDIKKLTAGRKITFTGHSQGGAVATVLAAMMSGQCDKLVTFGSPRVFSRSVAHKAAKAVKHLRVVDSNDIVPRVPKFCGRGIYSHFGELHFITKDGDVLYRPSMLRVLFERVIGFRFDMVRDHLMNRYLSRLEAFYEKGIFDE